MTQKKLLLYEDDQPSVEVVSLLFFQEGFEVKALKSAEQFEQDIKEYQPDVILMDYRLPGSDGGEITHRIKTEVSATIPIILYSADEQIQQIAEFVRADGFIAKPFDIDELVQVVKSVCQ